jgi:hypothetical protein
MVMSGVEGTGPVAMAAEAMTLSVMKARVFMTDPSRMTSTLAATAANLRCRGGWTALSGLVF